MPFPSLTFANMLENTTRADLEQFAALLQGYLSSQHDASGAHTDVTAVSVTTTADGTFGGDVTAQSGDTVSQCRMGKIIDANAGLAGTGLTSGIHLGGTKGWVLGLRPAGAPGSPADSEIRLFDLNHLVAGVSALRLFYYNANSCWTLGVETNGKLALGEDAAGKRLQEVNAQTVRAATAFVGGEVGDWTPALASTGGGAATYSAQSGRFSKAGYTVSVAGRITVSSLGTLGAGTISITGLPFTSENFVHAVLIAGFWNGLRTPVCYLSGFVNPNATTIGLVHATAAATGMTQTSLADLSNTTDILFSATYRATA